jgi:sulfur carrier protein
MNLVLNGEKRNMPGICTVSELLDKLKISGAPILVEQNGQVVPRTQFAATNLTDGDRIEIVRVVAGG